jgi:lipoprotein signal peptidase
MKYDLTGPIALLFILLSILGLVFSKTRALSLICSVTVSLSIGIGTYFIMTMINFGAAFDGNSTTNEFLIAIPTLILALALTIWWSWRKPWKLPTWN